MYVHVQYKMRICMYMYECFHIHQLRAVNLTALLAIDSKKRMRSTVY